MVKILIGSLICGGIAGIIGSSIGMAVRKRWEDING